MAQLSVQKSAPAGIAITDTAAAGGGDSFPAASNRVLRVRNADAASHDVIIASQKQCDQGFTHNRTVTVAAGATEFIGPLDPNRFADANGLVQVTYSAVTNLFVSVVEV